MQIESINNNNILKTWYRNFVLPAGVSVQFTFHTFFRHRILLNLRSPWVVHITVSVSVHITEKDIFYTCNFVYFNYSGMIADCTHSLLNIMKKMLNLKSGQAKLLRIYCKFGNFREGLIFAKHENKILTNWRNPSIVF